jgi:hypothetical protein
MWPPLCSLRIPTTSSEASPTKGYGTVKTSLERVLPGLVSRLARHMSACVCSLTRVGVMVLVCHESNDIFLEAAKVGGWVDGLLSWFSTSVPCPWASLTYLSASFARQSFDF